MDAIAAVGSVLLAICGLPQAILSLRTGNSGAMSVAFLTMWLLGEVLLTVYVVHVGQYVLAINYVANTAIAGVILRYRLVPRTSGGRSGYPQG
jgi:uncharacterized protein with PQ loop repeat